MTVALIVIGLLGWPIMWVAAGCEGRELPLLVEIVLWMGPWIAFVAFLFIVAQWLA